MSRRESVSDGLRVKVVAMAAAAKDREEKVQMVADTIKALAHNAELDRCRLDALEAFQKKSLWLRVRWFILGR